MVEAITLQWPYLHWVHRELQFDTTFGGVVQFKVLQNEPCQGMVISYTFYIILYSYGRSCDPNPILYNSWLNKLVLRATPFQLMIDIHSAVAICMCILKNSPLVKYQVPIPFPFWEITVWTSNSSLIIHDLMNPYSYQNTTTCMHAAVYVYKIIICSSKIKNSWYNIQICKLYNHGHMHMPACKPRCNSPKTCDYSLWDSTVSHTCTHTHTHTRSHAHTHTTICSCTLHFYHCHACMAILGHSQ